MATTKAKTTKKKTASVTKTTAKKKPTTKKTTTTKRVSTKPRTTVKAKSKQSKKPISRSFKLERSQEPFVSFRPTIQTLYWLILATAVLLLGLWVLDINQKVQAIYDEIDSNIITQSELDARELQIMRQKVNQKD